jgi:hypothetical protein
LSDPVDIFAEWVDAIEHQQQRTKKHAATRPQKEDQVENNDDAQIDVQVGRRRPKAESESSLEEPFHETNDSSNDDFLPPPSYLATHQDQQRAIKKQIPKISTDDDDDDQRVSNETDSGESSPVANVPNSHESESPSDRSDEE